MIIHQQYFEKPLNEDTKIWRYITLAKFVALLKSRSLFFSRADRLGDPNEGSLPDANIDRREEKTKNFSEATKRSLNRGKEWTKYLAINCWFMGNHESALMWEQYAGKEDGLAIQSTYSRLYNELNAAEEHICLGAVNYVDYKAVLIPEGNILWPFIHKKCELQDEHELRAIILKPSTNQYPTRKAIYDKRRRITTPVLGYVDYNQESIAAGIDVPVDLEALVERIVLPPTSSDWYGDVVKSLVKAFGVGSLNIESSSLSRKPQF